MQHELLRGTSFGFEAALVGRGCRVEIVRALESVKLVTHGKLRVLNLRIGVPEYADERGLDVHEVVERTVLCSAYVPP
jgi:hypothetical protein